VWSPPPESNRRPILTMEPPRTAVRMLVSPGHARPKGPKLSVLFRGSYALPQAMHWPSRRSHKPRWRPRAQHLSQSTPGSIQRLPRWGPLVGSAHPIVSLLRPAQAIAPRTMDRRGRAGASRLRPLNLWRGRLHGPSSSYPADLRGWSERYPSAARGASSGGQSRASPG
jgi:hypothetical protein